MDSGESMDASRMDGYPLPLQTSKQITNMLVGRIKLLLDESKGQAFVKFLDLLFVLPVLLSSDDGASCHDHPAKEHLGSNVKPSICSNLQVKKKMAKRELESVEKDCRYIRTSLQQENMSAKAI